MGALPIFIKFGIRRKPLLFVVILRVWWARWWQLWPQRVVGMASASQPAAGQNPKGDLDRKWTTKKTRVLLGKVICFFAIEKNCDSGHVKND